MRFFLCFLLLFSLLLSGCTTNSAPPTFYPSYPYTFHLQGEICGVECAFSVHMIGEKQGALTFTAPADLRDITFSLADTQLTVSLLDRQIPFTNGSPPGSVLAVFEVFSLSEEKLSSVQTANQATTLTYTYPSGYIALVVDAIGTPLSVELDLFGATASLSFNQTAHKESAS